MRRSFRIAALLAAGWTLSAAPAEAEDRVKGARTRQTGTIAALFREAKVAYPPRELLLRAFKHEGELELWAGDGVRPLVKVSTFRICSRSGELGPKRRLGDYQVPEGFYRIDRFNPWSNFHLSLGVSYPNEADRLLGVRGKLGGDIFIHGSCVTIGCLPIEDGYIEQLYLIALDARTASQRELPVHIFPRRMDEAGLGWLKARAGDDAQLWSFWRQLAAGYDAFEKTRRPPRVSVDPRTGAYIVAPSR